VLLGAGVGVDESPRLDGNGGLLGTVFVGGGGLWGIALFGASTVDLSHSLPKLYKVLLLLVFCLYRSLEYLLGFSIIIGLNLRKTLFPLSNVYQVL